MPALLVPYIAVALSIAHFALAAGVTLHVLAHNRNPGSAVSWIGLAWLSPVVGSLLYLFLGINRVQRRARSLSVVAADDSALVTSPGPRGCEHLAGLELAARRISRRNVQPGNAILMLANGDAAYPQMIAAIRSAATSVALSSYIFRADDVGHEFIAALIAARRRGVEIRVLIDGYGGGYLLSAAYRRLHQARVRVARFMHSALPWRMPFLNLRSHQKILCVDGRVAFTGGLNIGAENLVARNPRHAVLDTHFRFDGPVVAQLCEAFAGQWYFTTGETLAGPAWFPRLEPAGDSPVRAITSGPDQDLEKIEMLVLEAIACARSSIQIMTPYFLPDDRIITALALAAMRNVGVDIVLPEHSNHPTVDWAMRAHIGPLLTAGCRVWTHKPPFDHSKLMTVDGIWGLVGSANWDMRSFRLNFEINLEVYHSGLVEQVRNKIAANQSTRLLQADLDRRSLPSRLRDNAAHLMLPYL
ncbi:MAG TPA: phospholipase D-like domain-containing protein [Steroidobacteraceae bacterium]|nr:phospholipase D-like domain-containing protein [Steroidobacteraceae bacterium]